MALNGNHQIFYRTTTGTPYTEVPLRRAFLIPSSTPSWSHTRTHHHLTIVSASKKFSSSRTGKFDSQKKRSPVSIKEEEKGEEVKKELEWITEINVNDATGTDEAVDDGFVMPELPGEEPDFWEGPQWDGLGFFVRYMWALALFFAVLGGVFAFVTYTFGAKDAKETATYEESVESRQLLEEPEASNSDVFESNPTEEAPSLE